MPSGDILAKAKNEPVTITSEVDCSVVISAEEYDESEAVRLQNLKALIARSIAQAERNDLDGIDNVFSELSVDERAATGDKAQR
ncbi:type II toxin-antitoxin system Phd/YefM family antitoxin [Erwinia mallotivora]|uniref:type II toxin-antitoxin system Phd/YefM family antitoxin n=1 Tax=Erwinia mallotivora TaxID=69222 RepID=UPI0021C0DAAE|nr:type II toxin-antitoxin system Phd/YefM family antitoxin [Erwinia mallotivora]